MPGIHEGFGASKPRPDRIVYILAPKPGQPLDAVLLGNRVVRAEVHFDKSLGTRGKTLPCLGPPLCSYCLAGITSLEKHYLACCHPVGLAPFVLQLSEGAKEDVERIVAGLADWRGLLLRTSRSHKSKTARMLAESLGRFPGGPLPQEFYIPPILERTWGLTAGTRTDQRTRAPRPARSNREGRN